MLDPLPLRNPPWMQRLAQPVADRFDLPVLPAHIHEVVFAFSLYHVLMVYGSPLLSSVLFPRSYGKLNSRNRVNWDIHVVSFIQSVLVCALALYVKRYDGQRDMMGWRERVYGYSGGEGLVQAFATGYFLWDLYVCVRYYSLFGFGMLAHAVTSLAVYSAGFRPFGNYYASSFILYELSSPFLNIHWFCDKTDRTGGIVQLVNGVFLLVSFGGARLAYGTYLSGYIISDIYRAVRLARDAPHTPPLLLSPFAMNATTLFDSPTAALQVVRFAPATPHVPALLWALFLACNVTSHALNFYWYGKMIAAIRKRFDPPFGTRAAAAKKTAEKVTVERGVDGQGRKTLEVDAVELRRRAPVRLDSGEIPPPN